jgi:hypothetical protein
VAVTRVGAVELGGDERVHVRVAGECGEILS